MRTLLSGEAPVLGPLPPERERGERGSPNLAAPEGGPQAVELILFYPAKRRTIFANHKRSRLEIDERNEDFLSHKSGGRKTLTRSQRQTGTA